MFLQFLLLLFLPLVFYFSGVPSFETAIISTLKAGLRFGNQRVVIAILLE